jgi:hypothetical protein
MADRFLKVCLLVAALAAHGAVLADDGAAVQVVKVSGMTSMDLFERNHAMAPNAELRFELLPSRARTNMKGIELRVAGGDASVPVPLTDDMTFIVPRLSTMLANRAQVVSNRHKDSLLWRARIRTPGLPPNTRRLGDLRLEWHVDYVADLGPHWIAPGTMLIMAMMDRPYEMKGLHHVFLADRPLFGVTLAVGARRQVIAADMLYLSALTKALPAPVLWLWKDREFMKDRSFDLPLADSTWPDDTLVIIEYMDDSEVPAA